MGMRPDVLPAIYGIPSAVLSAASAAAPEIPCYIVLHIPADTSDQKHPFAVVSVFPIIYQLTALAALFARYSYNLPFLLRFLQRLDRIRCANAAEQFNTDDSTISILHQFYTLAYIL